MDHHYHVSNRAFSSVLLAHTNKQKKNQLTYPTSVWHVLHRSAKVALKTWSPVSVSVWHQQVVEQTPLDNETRMGDLEAKLKVTKLLLKNVLRRLETKKRKLSDLKDSLQNVTVTST